MKSLYPYLDTIANTQNCTPSFVKKLLRGETVLCVIYVLNRTFTSVVGVERKIETRSHKQKSDCRARGRTFRYYLYKKSFNIIGV